MPTRKDIFDYENAHKNRITLFSEGNFWRAFEQSAFLIVKHLWADIKVNGGYVKSAQEDIFFVGFQKESLQKRILDKLPNLKGAKLQSLSEKTAVIVDVPTVTGKSDKEEMEAFLEWKDGYSEKEKEAKKKLKNYYTELPIFKETYDLFNELLNIVRNFRRDVKYVIGSKIVEEGLELNQVLYQLMREKKRAENKTPSKSKEILLDSFYEQELLKAEVEKRLENLRFLLRISFDNKIHSTDPHLRISGKIDEIRKQLYVWTKSGQTSLPTSTTPTILQGNESETPSINSILS